MQHDDGHHGGRLARILGLSRRGMWLYAAGEIAITSIGILIALGANAWWQQRQDREFEARLLREMRIGLVADTIDIAGDVAAYANIDTTSRTIRHILQDNPPYNTGMDSLFGAQLVYRIHLSSSSAWETLKTRGVSLISDDSLRLRAIDFYTFGNTYISVWNTADTRLVETRIRPWYSSRFQYDGGHGVKARAKPLDYNSLLRDPEFRFIIEERIDLMKSALDTYRASHDNALWLIRRIDTHLAALPR